MDIKTELVIIIAAYHISIDDDEIHVLYISDGVINESLSSVTLVSIYNNVDNVDDVDDELSKDELLIFLTIQGIVNDEKTRLLKLKMTYH